MNTTLVREMDLREMDRKIQLIKQTAEELGRMAHQFPALAKNLERILASLKMLELNISDVLHWDSSG